MRPPGVITDSAVLARQLPIDSVPRVLVDQADDGAPQGDALASRRQALPRRRHRTGPCRLHRLHVGLDAAKPKGVVVPHRVLADLITWQCVSSELPPGLALAILIAQLRRVRPGGLRHLVRGRRAGSAWR